MYRRSGVRNTSSAPPSRTVGSSRTSWVVRHGSATAERSEAMNQRVRVVHAPAPSPAAEVLEGGPEAGVVGQVGVGGEVGPRRAGGEGACAPFGPEFAAVDGADEVDRSLQSVPVDDDADEVPVE